MAIRQQSLERVASLSRKTILNKIWSGAAYGTRAYIYRDPAVADLELSTPQCLLLALLHSLVTEEVMSCCLLAEICHQVRQLQSDHLRVWLTGDFVFPREDIEKAMGLLAKLLETGILKLPPHVARIMSHLATRYKIHGSQPVSPSMERSDDLADLLEDAVLNNSPGDIIAIASEGGDVNRVTQSGDSLIHWATRLGNCSAIAALGYLKGNLQVLNSSNATPLEEAVKNNCAPSVKALLSAGAKDDVLLFRGDTYLHIAAAGGHNRALEALLEGGVMNVNMKNHLNETPLFLAVRAGNVCGVEMLLEKGADIRILPEGSKSLLEISMESQNNEMLIALVKVATNTKFKDGDTIFHLVARIGNAEMLKAIKEMNLSANLKNQNGLTPLHVVSDPCVLKNLIEMGFDVNDRTEKDETALFLAAAKGSFELVRTIWQEGAAIDTQDCKGTSALMVAVKNSKEDIATFLLHKGADPKIKDKEGRTALHYAAEGGYAGLVTTLLEAGARVDDQDNKGCTPAFVAAVNNKLAVLHLLVENGADLVLGEHNGNEILHRVACSGYVEVVKMVLDAGANVDMIDESHYTALHWAADRGHNAVAKVLLNAGALVEMKTSKLWTALHLAARKGHHTVVKTLLDRGADLAAKTCDGWTPLLEASCSGRLPVVQLLVERGASINDKNNRGMTALDIAYCRHKSVADYLRSKSRVY